MGAFPYLQRNLAVQWVIGAALQLPHSAFTLTALQAHCGVVSISCLCCVFLIHLKTSFLKATRMSCYNSQFDMCMLPPGGCIWAVHFCTNGQSWISNTNTFVLAQPIFQIKMLQDRHSWSTESGGHSRDTDCTCHHINLQTGGGTPTWWLSGHHLDQHVHSAQWFLIL